MKPILVFFILTVSVLLKAQEPDSSSAIFKLREAERNFSRASATYGRKAAFAEYLAEKSVIYNDDWLTNGRDFWKNRKAGPMILKWEPEYMNISASRDFGISTGPWEAQEYRPYTSPLSTGYFLSVWKIQSDGSWKVILDAGVETPQLVDYNHGFRFPQGDEKDSESSSILKNESLSAELMEMENRLRNVWKKKPHPESYASFLDPDVIVLRNNKLPATRPEDVRQLICKIDTSLNWSTKGGGAAVSGDLGFTYGIIEQNGKTGHGYYVRIWEKKQGQDWHIIIDMMKPLD